MIAADSISALDTDNLNDVLEFVAALCEADMATIRFGAEDGGVLARVGFGDISPSNSDLFLEAVKRQNDLLIVPDVSADPILCKHPHVANRAGIRFFAAAPIRNHASGLVGAICVFGKTSRPHGLSMTQQRGLLQLAEAIRGRLLRTFTQQLLDEGNRFYQVVAELMPDMVWTSEPSGELDYFNPNWFEFTGAGPREPYERRWARYIYSEDRAEVERSWLQCLADGHPYRGEFRMQHHSGEHRWVLGQASPLAGPGGKIVKWIGTCTDIHAQKAAEAEALEVGERYRLAVRATRDAIWDWNLLTNEITWAEGAAGTLGYLEGQLGNSDDWWKSRVHPDDLRILTKSLNKVMKSGEKWEAEYRFRREDGSYTDHHDRAFLVRNGQGRPIRMVGATRDISGKNTAERALKASQERLHHALTAAKMVAWESDAKTRTIHRSENAPAMLGLPTFGNIGEILDGVHEDDRGRVAKVLRSRGSSECEFRYKTPDGRMTWLATRGEKSGNGRVVGVTYDTSERKKIEAELETLATHDPLTSLPNRRRLTQKFKEAIQKARKNRSPLSLILIDMDDFKDVNDTLGHEAGDALLKVFARRLRKLFGSQHTVARTGGDEFAILLCDSYSRVQAETFVRYVVDRMGEQQRSAGHLTSTRISLGLAHYPIHGRTAGELMRNADIALYESKKNGRNQATTFTPHLSMRIHAKISSLADIRRGFAASEFFPVYQPRIDLKTGLIAGFEALARWAHPKRGMLAPGDFALALQVDELSAELGRVMVRKVAADAAIWKDAGLPFQRVAVNFTSGDFNDPLLAESVLAVFQKAGLPATVLDVEVTETVLLKADAMRVMTTLERLRAAGALISLDDFGTGYASLTHLKQFPVHTIKIDRSFVRDLCCKESDQAIVSAIIGLATNLGLHVTAEGIETAAQAEWLAMKGCHFGQGYFFARPMKAEHVSSIIRKKFSIAPGED